jgi:hypothetical protein
MIAAGNAFLLEVECTERVACEFLDRVTDVECMY